MKKIKTLLAVLTLASALALSACGSGSSSTTEPEATPDITATEEPEASTDPAVTDGDNDSNTSDGEIDPDFQPGEPDDIGTDDFTPSDNDGVVEAENTPAKLLLAEFKAMMDEDGKHDAKEIAEKLISNSDIITFTGIADSVEPGYLNGFTEEIDGFKSGATFAPMIGSIPFVGYIFELSDDTDEEAFVQNLIEKSDLRWNICVEADERICEEEDGFVFFVMSPAEFEE